MIPLKQSTAATIPFGPFVDAADGFTAETSLTISQADIRLSKNGGAYAQTNNATGATHLENGYYSIPLNTTDTNTLGRLRVSVAESGARPVSHDFQVLAANVYDSLYGGTSFLRTSTGVQTVVQVVNSQTELELEGGYEPIGNNYQYGWALLRDATDPTGQTAVWRRITQSVGGGGSNTVITLSSSTGFTTAVGDIVELYPPSNVSHWLGGAVATPTVTGVPEVDVTHWIGTAAATPTTAGVPEVDVTHFDGVAYASRQMGTPNGGKVWWVNTVSGSDSNTGYTSSSAKQTFSAAQTAANHGDTIRLVGGSTAYPAITVSKSGITVIGDYRGSVTYSAGGVQTVNTTATVITTSSGAGVTVTGEHVTLVNLYVTSTYDDSAGNGLYATGITGLTVIGGSYTGASIGIYLYQCTNTVLSGAEFISPGRTLYPGTGAFIEADRNAHITGCRFLSTATTGTGYVAYGCQIYGCYDAIISNTRFEAVRTGASAQNTHALSLMGDDADIGPSGVLEPAHLLLDNCKFRVVADHASNTGEVACIGSGQPLASMAELRNPHFLLQNDGSGASYHTYAYTGSKHVVRGGNVDTTKITASTVQAVDVDVTSVLEDTSAIAALTAGSISIAPNLVPVPAARTWTLVQGSTGLVGDRTIGIRAGETKTFAIDFKNDLSANGLLTAFSSIAITTGTAGGVTFDTSDDGVNRTKAVIQMTGVTAGTYTLTATVTYDDSDGSGTAKGVVTLKVT
jgi:hypothetical protein